MLESLLESISSHAQLMLSVAVGGLGFILVAWASLFGLREDLKIAHYKWPVLLAVPFILFIGAYYYATEVLGAITGFQIEAVQGYTLSSASSANKEPIVDSSKHFLTYYEPRITEATQRQYICNSFGIATLVFWFLGNFLFGKCANRSRTEGKPSV